MPLRFLIHLTSEVKGPTSHAGPLEAPPTIKQIETVAAERIAMMSGTNQGPDSDTEPDEDAAPPGSGWLGRWPR